MSDNKDREGEIIFGLAESGSYVKHSSQFLTIIASGQEGKCRYTTSQKLACPVKPQHVCHSKIWPSETQMVKFCCFSLLLLKRALKLFLLSLCLTINLSSIVITLSLLEKNLKWESVFAHVSLISLAVIVTPEMEINLFLLLCFMLAQNTIFEVERQEENVEEKE